MKNNSIKRVISAVLTFALVLSLFVVAVPARRAEAATPGVQYRSYVQKLGWEKPWLKNGALSGKPKKNKRIESIQIKLVNKPATGNIKYRVYVQKDGWTAWKLSGDKAGTQGKSKRIEAIQIKLTGNMAKKYDILYTAYVQNQGWQECKKNGETAGITGKGLRLEGLKIRLVGKSDSKIDISKRAVITLEDTCFTYDGSGIKPDVSVVYNAAKLKKGTDYTVSYSNNVNPGTGIVTITGIGKYKGSVKRKFEINKIHIFDYRCSLPAKYYDYTGEPITPPVTVKTPNGTVLAEGTDYTVSYSDNVECGWAFVDILGTGNYAGTLRCAFIIQMPDISDCEVIIPSLEYDYTGEPITPPVTVKSPNGAVLTEGKDYTVSYHYNTDYGMAYISVTGIGLYVGIQHKNFKIKIPINETATTYGFADWRNGFKRSAEITSNDDGTVDLCATFYCDADESWIDNNVTFKCTDVTPKGIKQIFEDMDYPITPTDFEPTYKTITFEDLLRSKRMCDQIGGDYTKINPPLDNTDMLKGVEPQSGKVIQLKVGIDVRVVRVDAIISGQIVDTIYMLAKSGNPEKKLFRDVRHKIEDKLWTDYMTTEEKILSLSSYIERTAHYPTSDCTKLEVNPYLWDKYGVDGIRLYPDMYAFGDPTMDCILALQGGIFDCTASNNIILPAATEDIGLPLLKYDSETGTRESGEGVWMAYGENSSSPKNLGHHSLCYKNQSEIWGFIDTQGNCKNGSCLEHGCLEHIIPLTD